MRFSRPAKPPYSTGAVRRRQRGKSADVETALTKLTEVVESQQRKLVELTDLVTRMAQDCTHDRALLASIGNELQAHRHGDVQRVLDGLRIVRDHDEATRLRLLEARQHPDYALAFTEPEPLVSVVIATYWGADSLRDRAIPSVLAQSHSNLEIIIVGDGDPPGVRDVVEKFGDPRLRYVTRPYRGPYPSHIDDAWLVSGTPPLIDAFRLARGRWTAPLGDDDAFHPNHIQQLLNLAREQQAELAYGLLMKQVPGQDPVPIGRFPPEHAQFGLQAALIHGHMRFIELSPSDFIFRMPNDWTFAERLLRIGVRFAMCNAPTVDYYPSMDYGGRAERRARGEF